MSVESVKKPIPSSIPNPPAASSEKAKRPTIPGASIFPTEDAAKYRKFRDMIEEEFMPIALAEKLIIFRVADLLWRLNGLAIFRKAETAHKNFAPFLGNSVAETSDAYFIWLYDSVAAHRLELVKRNSMTQEDADARFGEEGENSLSISQFRALFDNVPIEEFAERCLLMEQMLDCPPLTEREVHAVRQAAKGTMLELAHFADAVTVNNYMTELKVVETIMKSVDQNLALFWKLKKRRFKPGKQSKRRSRLLPPY